MTVVYLHSLSIGITVLGPVIGILTRHRLRIFFHWKHGLRGSGSQDGFVCGLECGRPGRKEDDNGAGFETRSHERDWQGTVGVICCTRWDRLNRLVPGSRPWVQNAVHHFGPFHVDSLIFL
jgi:hypothetical protein